jgi:hypothetical protein
MCTCHQWWHNPSRKFLGRRKQIRRYVRRRVYEETGGKKEEKSVEISGRS